MKEVKTMIIKRLLQKITANQMDTQRKVINSRKTYTPKTESEKIGNMNRWDFTVGKETESVILKTQTKKPPNKQK